MFPFIKILHLQIPVYGFMITVGIILSGFLFSLISSKKEISGIDKFILFSFPLFGGLAGAKLLFLITIFPDLIYFFRNGQSEFIVMAVAQGGMVFYGGVLGGILSGYFTCRYLKISPLKAADLLAAPLALGQAFGRIGCFASGCCYGIPNEKLGIMFSNAISAPNGVKLLPVQLFESAFDFFLAAVLSFLVIKEIRHIPALIYLYAYSAWRFFIEFFRGDKVRGFVLGLSTSQFISVIIFIFTIIFHIYLSKNRKLCKTKKLSAVVSSK